MGSRGLFNASDPKKTPITLHYIELFLFSKPIAGGETVTEKAKLTPRKSGNKEIVASFSADRITGVRGTVEVYVKFGY